MLISQNKIKNEHSEWQNLDRIELSPITRQNSIKPNQIQSGIIDEYGKLFGTIFAEYIKQMEIFSELQKSNTEMLINSFSTTYNFFNLSADINRKLVFGFLKK